MKKIQPSEIFSLLRCKDFVEAEKVLSTAYSFLAYLKPGDSLVTSSIEFHRLDDNLLYVNTILDPKTLSDNLEKRRILKIPV